MSYKKGPLVKIKNGVVAPSGFHYMPSGKLMPDADHVAIYGYFEQKINSLEMDLSDLPPNSSVSRSITIRGDEYAVFSLEIYSSAGTYYNFNDKTWVSYKTKLRRKRVNNTYTTNVKFPQASSVNYTVSLYAEIVENIKTTHVDFVDFRNADNSVNVNKTQGSNSNVLTRTIYQDALVAVRFGCVAPSLYATSNATVNGATSGSNRLVVDGVTAPYRVGDKITGTGIASSVHALISKINPDGDNANEIEMSVADSATNDDVLTITPPFNGMTPHYGVSTTGMQTLNLVTGSSNKTSFTITITALSGRTFNIIRTPSVEDLCTVKTVTFGAAALPLEGENTASDTVFYRWPVDNIAGLSEGMVLDSNRSGSGLNTTTPAIIASYTLTVDTTEVLETQYDYDIKNITSVEKIVPGVDPVNNDVTAVDRNGRVTAQAGNLIFSKQQVDALKSDSNVLIYAYGKQGILAASGMSVDLSNVTIEATQVSTTTSGAVSDSTTIGLAEVGNVSVGMSVRGVGINAAVANPTIVSKSVATGAGNIVVSSAQTLQSGQTLYFDGGSNIITLSGDLEISNTPIAAFDLQFDVERFLSAS